MSNITVQIDASTADLNAKLAVATANFKAFSAETRTLADQFRAAGAEARSTLLPSLEASATAAARAKVEMTGLRQEVAATGAASTGIFAGMTTGLESMAASTAGVTNLFRHAGEAFLAAFVAERVISFATAAAELGHKLVDTAEATGISVERLAALKFAADITGTSFDNFTRVMVKFESNLQASLKHPTDDAALALRALGISADFVRKNTNDLGLMLETVAQRLFQFEAGGTRAEIEAKLLGQRMGPELIPILKKLADEGFGGLAEQARKANIALDDASAKKLAADYEKLKLATEGLSFSIGETFLPALTVSANQLRAWVDWLHGIDEEMGRFNQRIREFVGLSSGVDIALKPGANPFAGVKKSDAPSIAGGGAGTADPALITQADELEKQLNADLQERLRLIDSAQSVSNAYYSRLEQDTRAAAAEGKISADEEYRQLVVLEQEKFGLLDRSMQEKLRLEREVGTQDQELLDREKVAYEQHLQALDRLRERYTAQQKRAAEQEARDWEKALQPVEGFFQSIASSMLSSHRTFAQSVLLATQQMVEREIGELLKLGLRWAVHEALQTAETKAGVAARTAAEASGNVSFFGQIGQQLSRWLGLETSKTAGTEAGAAARAAAQTAAATASLAADVALGFAQIEVDASVGAAAAFADSAELGPEGLAAAPAVAAATYAEILGFAAGMGGGIALAEGAWNIPRTMGATLHEGEAVLPKPFAEEYRAGNAQGGINFHITTMDAGSMLSALRNAASPLSKAIRHAVRNGNSDLRAALPAR